jgi:signal transduction histidine kinase
MRSLLKSTFCVAALTIAFAAGAQAGEFGTKAEAEALVKKAVAAIKAEGAEKVYGEITAKDAKYIDRDLYPVVYTIEGKCLSHGANPKLVGKDLIDVQDPDGVYFVKERTEKAKTQDSFWQEYKYKNPVSGKIEPKEAYCEKLESTLVCAGAYKQ